MGESEAGGGVTPQTPPRKAMACSVSRGFVDLLGKLNISVAFTSYQSGRLYLLGRNPNGGLMVHERLFQKAMGLCVEDSTLVLATLFQIQRFEDVLEPGQLANGIHDACYVPRVTWTTGALDVHDVGLMGDGRIAFVNTRYNCLAVPSTRHSFTPVWKPSFISALVGEDRCHLNGLAMEAGRPRYVTAVSRSDAIDGWRDRRRTGGVVMDVERSEVVCQGLSMPHSPRLADGRLWLLNSGTGELGFVDREKKAFHPVAFCPGFLRGLAIRGRYAFVGLSKPRHARFEGLELDDRLQAADSEPWCGIQVIDIETGTCVEWFRIDDTVDEIYDTALIPNVACPMALGFTSNEIRKLITQAPFDALPGPTQA